MYGYTTERTGLIQNGRSDEGESGGERGSSLRVAAAQPQGYFQERMGMREGTPIGMRVDALLSFYTVYYIHVIILHVSVIQKVT